MRKVVLWLPKARRTPADAAGQFAFPPNAPLSQGAELALPLAKLRPESKGQLGGGRDGEDRPSERQQEVDPGIVQPLGSVHRRPLLGGPSYRDSAPPHLLGR